MGPAIAKEVGGVDKVDERGGEIFTSSLVLLEFIHTKCLKPHSILIILANI